MRVVLGIGNIGERYSLTKHNIGFILLDSLAQKLKNPIIKQKKNYLYTLGRLKGEEYLLVKPTTYVNKSGDAAFYIFKEYNLDIQDLLVVTDDINLELGKIRIRKGGGDGGHNGLASIIDALGSTEFARMRFGIGNQFEKGEMADYVLSPFSDEEIKVVNSRIDFCNELIISFIFGGLKNMLDNFSKNSSNNNPSLTNKGSN